jgi:hypothetical protein
VGEEELTASAPLWLPQRGRAPGGGAEVGVVAFTP